MSEKIENILSALDPLSPLSYLDYYSAEVLNSINEIFENKYIEKISKDIRGHKIRHCNYMERKKSLDVVYDEIYSVREKYSSMISEDDEESTYILLREKNIEYNDLNHLCQNIMLRMILIIWSVDDEDLYDIEYSVRSLQKEDLNYWICFNMMLKKTFKESKKIALNKSSSNVDKAYKNAINIK